MIHSVVRVKSAYKTSSQCAVRLGDQLVLLKVTGEMSGGKTSEIDFQRIRKVLRDSGALEVLLNYQRWIIDEYSIGCLRRIKEERCRIWAVAPSWTLSAVVFLFIMDVSVEILETLVGKPEETLTNIGRVCEWAIFWSGSLNAHHARIGECRV